MSLRNRVKELRHVPASSLIANPKNWRLHPESQKKALKGVLDEVGLADACIARELPDGSLMLVDGHLRAETVADEVVPVLVLDVSEEEANKILVTLDPLAAMAETDHEALSSLVDGMSFSNDAMLDLVANVASNTEFFEKLADTDDGDNPYTARVEIPPYEVKGEIPSLSQLYDKSKVHDLLAEIEAADIPEDEKDFLRAAAWRHAVFNFESIANYYAGASISTQELMENSALVIVDIDKAIESGWARLGDRLKEQYSAEYGNAG